MSSKSYGLFCPLAMACEVIEPRWTLLILNEMWEGATRFNEIRRGVPGISPTLLSKRLRELEARGLIERLEDRAKGTVDYVRTPKAKQLEPALDVLARWAYRHIEADVAFNDLNTDYLMWNIRGTIDASVFPERRTVIRFHFTDIEGDKATNWLIARPGTAVELCMSDPQFDVNLYVEAHSKALASVWMEYSSLQDEMSRDRIFLSGDPRLIKTIDSWFVKHSFAMVS
jgi:DNA-binding HxlR family transcriptional regulator